MCKVDSLIQEKREEHLRDHIVVDDVAINLLDIIDTVEPSLAYLASCYVALEYEIHKAELLDRKMEVRRLNSWLKIVYRLMVDLWEYQERKREKELERDVAEICADSAD